MARQPTFIRGARLFDGHDVVAIATVTIDGSRIVGVGDPPGADAAGVDAVVTDLGDVTLLPGLVDTHQHLCFDGQGTLEEQVAPFDDDVLAARAVESASRALRGGVTAIRDLGDRNFVTLPLRHRLDLPTIVTAGPPITRPGGHCWYLGGECEGDADLRRAVDERAERGCDVVKVMVSGGFNTPTDPVWKSQFEAPELRAIVDRAHHHSKPVAAHCHGVRAIEHALDAGADSIEHCTFMDDQVRCDPPTQLLRWIAESGVAISATLGRVPDHGPLPPFVAANLPALQESRRRIHELGGTIVVGTDAGISEMKPHDVLPHALEDLRLSGMTALEALAAMTSVAARVVGLAGTKGRLAPGFDADVIAVRGDPATDSSALADVAAVWRAGVRVV